MTLRIFDSGDTPGGVWLTATEAVAETLELGLIPVAIPVEIGGEISLVAAAFPQGGRVGATAHCADPRMRARLALGLIEIARSRVSAELGVG